MLVVCVSSTDPDYTTTGPVLLELFGQTSSGDAVSATDIRRISDLIRAASRWAETYVGRPLGLQVYSETLAAAGDNLLVLGRRPVHAVLRLFDSTASCDATELCSTDYRVEDAEAGFLGRDKGFAWTAQEIWGKGDFSLGLTGALLPGHLTRPWMVEYGAGYVPIGGIDSGSGNWATQATSTSRTLPDDIERAVVFKVSEWWDRLSGIRSERVGDLAVEYTDRAGTLGPAEALLEPYRSAL